jgi:hypothetical protein
MPHPRIGTSGWSYDHWTGPFYPEGLPADRRLAHYATRLDCAEINNTFYSLPSVQTLAQWRDCVPEDFRFAVKASRYITHMKKLKDPDTGLGKFLPRIEGLGDRLGPILFQLPPKWRFDADRLAAFLDALPDGHRYALEFRDTAGSTTQPSSSSPSTGRPSASTSSPATCRRSRSPPTSSTFACMDRTAPTAAATRTPAYTAGPNASVNGGAGDSTAGAFSTTTRPAMPSATR